MAPKAKGKAKARAGGAAGVPPGRRLRRPAALVGRRPAARQERDEVVTLWEKGEIVPLYQLDPREVTQAQVLVVEEGKYYHRQVKVAGVVSSVSLQGQAWYLQMRLTGTQDEELLKFHTGHPEQEFRLHVCDGGCNQEEVADDLVHALHGHQGKPRDADEAWTRNLIKEKPEREPGDELAVLRERLGKEEEARLKRGEEKSEEAEDRKKKKKKSQKKKKGKKKDKEKAKEKEEKEAKKKRRSSGSDSSWSEDGVKMDGSEAKQACQKKQKTLYRGTGMDPRDKVRNRVARAARRRLKKKSEKDSLSASGSSSSNSSGRGVDATEETIFEASSRVQVVADHCPGALANQALNSMRATLLQEVGFEDRPNVLYPAAVAYFRQHLQRRVSGPTQRELMTLTHSIDQLVRGRVASALDTLVQRVKSIEQTVTGAHWSVSQRLEVLPPEATTLTAVPESSAAQREVYQEAKARWLASFPEGKGLKGQKGQGKGRGEGKDKGSQGADRERKGGKGKPNKAEVPANKKD